MRNDVTPFEAWLLVSARLDLLEEKPLKTYQHYRIKAYHGKPVTAPLVRKVVAIYRTESEARSAVEELAGRNISVNWSNPHPGLYDTAVAWLVTFTVLMQETYESIYSAEATFGGKLHWTDDRDVMGSFATFEEAQAYADAMNRATGRSP